MSQGIEEEIASKSKKLDYLDQAALFLIQQGDSLDAVRVQKDMEDFRQDSKDVFTRVHRCLDNLKAIQVSFVSFILFALFTDIFCGLKIANKEIQRYIYGI